MRDHFSRFVLVPLTAVLLAGISEFFPTESVPLVFAEETQATIESPASELQPQPEIGENVEAPIDPLPQDGVSERAVPPGALMNGQACTAPSDCQSGSCYQHFDGRYYCMAQASQCASPGTAGVLYGTTQTNPANGVTYQCKSGTGSWFPLGTANISNGQACTLPSDCQSGSCYQHFDGRYYCMAQASQCASPGTAGVLYGATQTNLANGVTYECKLGTGSWFPLGKPNGFQCGSASDCFSQSCYPYFDGKAYCMAQASQCASPGTAGVLYGTRTRNPANGVDYECKSGTGNWWPLGPANGGSIPDGGVCTLSSACKSTYCYPYFNGYAYCIAGASQCASPGTAGVLYGATQTNPANGVTYQCKSGTGSWFPLGKATYPNGQACTLASDCQSGSCYQHFDGQRYCMAQASQCASPGTAGVLYGTTQTNPANGVTYQCKSGTGSWSPLGTATIPNGQTCTLASDCQSGSCYQHFDGQRYCMARESQCASPGTAGVLYGTHTVSPVNGVEYWCKPETGNWFPLGKPNGAQCSTRAECASGQCYPYPDFKNYCIQRDLNCAWPNSNGVGWNTKTQVGSDSFVCTSGVGWADSTCTTVEFRRFAQCRNLTSGQNFCPLGSSSFPIARGYGLTRECNDKSGVDKFLCNRQRETEMLLAKPYMFELDKSASIARKTSLPMPPMIKEKLGCFFTPGELDGVRYTTTYKPEKGLLRILAGITGGLLGLASTVPLPTGWQDIALITGQAAITLGPDIIAFATAQDAETNAVLWSHELEHIRQYRELGVEGFADMYWFHKPKIESDARRRETYVYEILSGK